jgi:hypothetical protein
MRSRCYAALLAGIGALLACGSPEKPAAKPPLTLERVPMPGNLKVPFSAAPGGADDLPVRPAWDG